MIFALHETSAVRIIFVQRPCARTAGPRKKTLKQHAGGRREGKEFFTAPYENRRMSQVMMKAVLLRRPPPLPSSRPCRPPVPRKSRRRSLRAERIVREEINAQSRAHREQVNVPRPRGSGQAPQANPAPPSHARLQHASPSPVRVKTKQVAHRIRIAIGRRHRPAEVAARRRRRRTSPAAMHKTAP